MTILDRLTRFVRNVFKTNLEVFLEALRMSPNAQGYVSGSITEFLLKKKLEAEYGFEVLRIREKWEGTKHARHHGDFYFRRPDTNRWYVMESKGVKSNSEKWHKLYNHDRLKAFLIAHSDKIYWMDPQQDAEPQVDAWIHANLPAFYREYASAVYEYEEVRDYLKTPPKRETPKSRAIAALRDYTREQLSAMVDERLEYVMSRVRVLETHFVSGTSASGNRTQATPRKDEFNAVAIDIVLRFPEHRFLFANPLHLESSGDDPNHLQQNYVMGFVFTDGDACTNLSMTEEWCDDLTVVYDTLRPEDSVREEDMQVDHRRVIMMDEV